MGFDFSLRHLQEQGNRIDTLIEEKVLVRLSPKLFPGEKGDRGTLIMLCSDGDQFGHIFGMHHVHCNTGQCHHVISDNGLGLRIARNSPVALDSEHKMWARDALTGALIKDLRTVIIYGHWPCGIAEQGELPLDVQIELYLKAKEELKEYFDANNRTGMNVMVGLQVEHGHDPRVHRDIYYVDRHAWNNFLSKEQARNHLKATGENVDQVC